MKALVLRGRNKGKVFEISQWCNDWFSVASGIPEIDCKPFSPSSLAFDTEGFRKIQKHKNNGTLFMEFEGTPVLKPTTDKYLYTFKRRHRSKMSYY